MEATERNSVGAAITDAEREFVLRYLNNGLNAARQTNPDLAAKLAIQIEQFNAYQPEKQKEMFVALQAHNSTASELGLFSSHDQNAQRNGQEDSQQSTKSDSCCCKYFPF
ncbi:MAG: hypothetical protein VXW87_05165 [Pseudomonadota bacterium]|nr:hypothetical protein [Pseudomonadota bacterium]